MTMIQAPEIPGFRLGYPEVTPRLPLSDAPQAESMTRRHRPKLLADVVGQGAAVFRLESYLECPHPVAFIFAGPTGVGKTSTALALAAELGVIEPSPDLVVIESGRQNGDAVEWILDLFRFPPMYGGFRVVIVNEADMMTEAAAKLWLSGLESIPARTVIILTTNAPDRFPDRFLDRCERIDFASDADMLGQDAQALLDRIWKAETGRDDAPRVGEIPNVVDKRGCISFRRCVSALDPMLRAAARAGRPDGPRTPPDAPTVAFRAPTPTPAPTAPTPSWGDCGPDGRGIPTIAPRPSHGPASAPPRAPRTPGSPRAESRSLRRQLREIEREFTGLGNRHEDLEAEEARLKRDLSGLAKGDARDAARRRLEAIGREYGAMGELATSLARQEEEIEALLADLRRN